MRSRSPPHTPTARSSSTCATDVRAEANPTLDRSALVYVHGLWLSGWESTWLRARVGRALGCRTLTFGYRSVGGHLAEHAATLAKFLGRVDADTLHLIGHSLGGIVILECFARYIAAAERDGGRALPPGRVVLLGSPVRGSEAAHRLARLRYGAALLGPMARQVLIEPMDHGWSGPRELGVIAGDLALGLGRFVGRLPRPSDGTVMVEETELAGAKERLILPVSHSGLLLSSTVAQRVTQFLSTGSFAPLPAAARR